MQVLFVCAAIAILSTPARGQGRPPADTSRPPLPTSPNLPSDSTVTVEGPGYHRSDLLYYRNIVGIVFDDTTSGTTIRDLLRRYRATIVGGVPGPAGDPEFIVRVPDPGRTFVAVD